MKTKISQARTRMRASKHLQHILIFVFPFILVQKCEHTAAAKELSSQGLQRDVSGWKIKLL
jgi:hypothetical protein